VAVLRERDLEPVSVVRRFDERELEIELLATTPALWPDLSFCLKKHFTISFF